MTALGSSPMQACLCRAGVMHQVERLLLVASSSTLTGHFGEHSCW